MHLGQATRFRFVSFSVIFFLSFVVFLNLLDSGTYKLNSRTEKIQTQIEFENQISVYIQLLNFDSASQTLKARIWIVPPEKYANNFDSSVQVKYDTQINISASTISYNDDDNSGFWFEKQYLRAIDVELDADNREIHTYANDKYFPLDRYSIALTGLITFRVAGSDTETSEDDIWESLPVGIQPYTASLSGWSALFKLDTFVDETVSSSFREGETFTSDIILERTSLNRVLVILIGLIFLSGGLSMLLLFRSILMTHRPPTLSGLIWAGSTAFTMIQTRTIVPGAPRIGVKFDLFIFYPSLVMCFVSGGLMFYHWVSKDTWSREL